MDGSEHPCAPGHPDGEVLLNIGKRKHLMIQEWTTMRELNHVRNS